MKYTIEHSRMMDSSGNCGRWNAFVLCFLVLFGVLRFIIVVAGVTVHNDERHYALDGFWARAELPAASVVSDLLYNHTHPHPLYDPKTGSIGHHGKMPKGQLGKGDLGPYPRAGHPCLFMLVLGAIYALLPTSWLLQGDSYVHVARAVNICFDTAACFLLFDILRRFFSSRIACGLLVVLVSMPFVLVNGALAYLDSFGTFWSTAAIWYYITRIRNRRRFQDWILLGILLALAILSKQSNFIVIPLFAGVMILFPVPLPLKILLQSLLCAAVCGLIMLCILSNPFAYKKDFRYVNKQILHTTQPGKNKIVLISNKAFENLSLPFRPKHHYHFGVLRHKGIPYVKIQVIVRGYEISTPLAAAVIYLSCILLVVRRKYRTWPLILGMLVVIAIIPLGNVLRRLYILIPYATLIVALAITETGGMIAKIRGKAGGWISTGCLLSCICGTFERLSMDR